MTQPSMDNAMRRLVPLVLGLAVLLTGCVNRDREPPGRAAEANTTDPYWVEQSTPRRKIAVVFVHGLFGDTTGTWTNDNGASFFDLLKSAPEVGGKVDIFAFGFTSNMISGGSLDIGQASVTMHESLDYHGVTDYESIVFVAHSMGGLITMRELISHPELRGKVPLLVFYATPQEGAQISRIARLVVKNPAVRQMFPADANAYLRQLNEDWVRVRNSTPRPTLVCAYETLPTGGAVTVVPWATATRNCDAVAPAISEADHITLVKPDRQEHEAVIVLVNALRRHVLPTLEASAWATPDFVPEADHWTFPITDINGRNGAGIVNRSGIPQHYRVEVDTPRYLMVSPEAMPRVLPADSREDIKLVLVNELQPEYRLRLRLGSSPERLVIARIPDMQAALAERAQRINTVAEAMNSYLASEQNRASFNLLSAAQQDRKAAGIALTALAPQTSDLPPGSRWIIVADTLSSIEWPQRAAVALRMAERTSPRITTHPGVRHLAAVVASQAGGRGMPHSAPLASPPSIPPEVQLARSEDPGTWKQLAERMQAVPAMRSDGFLLEGDLLSAEGDSAGAQSAWLRADEIRSTPITEQRLEDGTAETAELQVERDEGT